MSTLEKEMSPSKYKCMQIGGEGNVSMQTFTHSFVIYNLLAHKHSLEATCNNFQIFH